jgi:hypothetical protein
METNWGITPFLASYLMPRVDHKHKVLKQQLEAKSKATAKKKSSLKIAGQRHV